MANILVIEDEPDLLQVLDYNLTQAGHTVTCVAQGYPGLELARKELPQLILLDLMLPDVSGTDVCRLLKERADTKSIPVIMVTARGEEIDRVVGFELGADDYVVKPFSVRELLLRIQAILRRNKRDSEIEASDMVEFGRLRIDRGAHRVWVERPGDRADGLGVSLAGDALRAEEPCSDPNRTARRGVGDSSGYYDENRGHPREAASRKARGGAGLC